MIHFVVAFAMLLHVLFWGVGLAMLIMPRPWRRFWSVLVMPAGWALQSAVVWAGVYANLRGTNAYAWWAELVPLALLALGLWRRGLRPAFSDASRLGLVWAGVAACGVLLVLPLAVASKGLTTISLGSCDAADYAAGARVLMEFAHGDRSGFLGLTEVVRVQSVDNFFDFYLRINHFTPSALIALNGSVLHCAPHELTSLLTMMVLAGSVPVVFWVARAVAGYSGGVSTVIAVLYGVSPVTWYMVGHVSPAPLIAAPAIALITWAGVVLWRGRLTWSRGVQFGGVLAMGYSLVLGSYNFILPVCLVPVVAYAGGLALRSGAWRRLGRWWAVMLAPLALCALAFPARVGGLVERFTQFRMYDFGWRIPALGPEGWLGMVQGPDLRAWDLLGVRWVLAAVVVGLLGWALIRAVGQRQRGAWLVTCLAAPVLAGYLFLEVRGARLGTNASYDAYKLFVVFYALLLPAFCWWVTLRRSRRLSEWLIVFAAAVVVIGFNLAGMGMFMFRLSRPPLIVDGELRQLRRIDAMPDVKSVNLFVPDMWSRLWANSFLLHKPQFFLTHTYEGRLNTPLRGDWDLEAGMISIRLPGDGRRQITPRFALVDTRHPQALRASIGDGWHQEESIPRTSERWRWTQADATLQVENPHAYPLTIICAVDGRSVGVRDVSLAVAGPGATPPTVRFGEQRSRLTYPALTVPPGKSTLLLHSQQPATPAGSGDPRLLALCVFKIEIEVRPGP